MDKKISRMFDSRSAEYDKNIEMFRNDKFVSKYIEIYFRMIDSIVNHIGSDKKAIVLDIGTGTGRLALEIAGRVRRVVGIDISEKMLEAAKNNSIKSGIKNIDFRCGSFLRLDCFKKQFDVIVSNLALHHLTDEEKLTAARNMRDSLKNNGKLVIGDVMFFFNPRINFVKWWLMKRHIKRFAGRMLKEQVFDFRNEHVTHVKKLKAIFEKSGFRVVGIKRVFPLAGVVFAQKSD